MSGESLGIDPPCPTWRRQFYNQFAKQYRPEKASNDTPA